MARRMTEIDDVGPHYKNFLAQSFLHEIDSLSSLHYSFKTKWMKMTSLYLKNHDQIPVARTFNGL